MHGAELISELLKHSPFVGHLGIELRQIEDDRAQEPLADIQILRRGSSLSFCEVKVRGADDDALVATGLVTYELSSRT